MGEGAAFDVLPDLSEDIFAASRFEGGPGVTIPPPSFVSSGGKMVHYERKRLLRCAFPLSRDYANPVGFLQGGYLTALMDDTFGPLSYLVAGRPAVTIHLATTFVRPVSVEEPYLLVEAEVVSRGRQLVTMRGEVSSSAGKLLATATSVNQITQL